MPGIAVLQQHPDYVLLLFLRISGLFIGGPVFGRKNIPSAAKIGFCAVLTLVFLAGMPTPQAYPEDQSLIEYVLLCMRELVFGGAMGYVLTAMLELTLTAGTMIDYQIGYTMSNIYDPQNNMQMPITGGLLNYALIVIFFSVDGHLKLIDIMYHTLEAVPIGTPVVAPEILWAAVEVMSKSFVLAVMVAMPVLAAGMMLEIALGATIKVVPQMNMFVVGIPLKIIVGLLVLILTLTMFSDFSNVIFTKLFDAIGTLFQYIGSAP